MIQEAVSTYLTCLTDWLLLQIYPQHPLNFCINAMDHLNDASISLSKELVRV